MRYFSFAVVCICIVISSCGFNEGYETNLVVEERPADSTTYYDSLFASRKFTIDTFFRNKNANGLFNGNFLVAEKGRIIHQGSYGTVTPSGKDSLTIEHQFQLASVSKPFTAAGILLLNDRGLLSLSDTIGKYTDSFPYPGITIHHLLCHRGGLTNYTYFCDEYRGDKSTPVTNEEVVALMTKCKPKPYYSPDQKFDYSNTGYMLLAFIIEKISRKNFEDFMREEIFVPLGMTHSFIHNQNRDTTIATMLSGYDSKGRTIGKNYLNGATGDKGMYSTVGDLFIFSEAIRRNKLLKKETWEKAFSPHNPELVNTDKDNYGYGWRLKTSFAGYEVVYHTGWWKGFRSYFIRNLTLDQTIIVLDNYKRNPFFSVEELLNLGEEKPGSL